MIHVRRYALGTLAALLALCVWATPIWAQDAEGSHLTIQDVESEDFPDVRMSVAIPAEVLQAGEVSFDVTENGRDVEVLAVDGDAAESEPIDVVLVIDTSGSMDGESMESARAAASGFIRTLREDSRVAIVAISTTPRLVSPFTADRASLEKAIASLEAGGETALNDSLLIASELTRTTASNPAGIVLLSDGGDTMSRVDLGDALSSVQSAEVPVYAVALPSYEADPAALRTLAEQSGGRLVPIADITGLTELYRGLAEELQDRFVIVYRSEEPRTADLEIGVTALAGSLTADGFAVVDNPIFGSPLAQEPATLSPAQFDPAKLVIAIVLVWVAVALLILGLTLFLIRPRTTIDQVRYYEQYSAQSDLPTAEDAEDQGIRNRMVGAVEYVAGKRGLTQYVTHNLERAGLPLRAPEYMSLHIVVVIATGVFTQFVTRSVLVGVVAVLVATIAPMLFIASRARRRTSKFEDQLPDVLNMISGSLRAGWGLLQSVDLVVDEMLPPASEEFRRVQTEARLGLPLEDAMQSMAERVDSDDVRWVVSAVTIQREVGGNLAEVLDVVADTIRDRAALRRHISALTAEGRLSGYILVALPFVLLLLLGFVNPPYVMRLFATPQGLTLTGIGALLMVIGVIWLSRAVKVEV